MTGPHGNPLEVFSPNCLLSWVSSSSAALVRVFRVRSWGASFLRGSPKCTFSDPFQTRLPRRHLLAEPGVFLPCSVEAESRPGVGAGGRERQPRA